MIDLRSYSCMYFVGIGGIGMSALARFFKGRGYLVAGYDRVKNPVCESLLEEGIDIHFKQEVSLIPQECLDPETTLVIYTPAVKEGHKELAYFRENAFRVRKRAEVLGLLANEYISIAVAGTHGKTSVSSMIAHILYSTPASCFAFLGGIMTNYHSNYLDGKDSERVVIEADEYDRSFLHLKPEMAVITSMDADHLDVYYRHNALKHSFYEFADRVQNALIVKHGLRMPTQGIRRLTYSLDNPEADYYADIKGIEKGCYSFDLHTPSGKLEAFQLAVPGILNMENAVAACAVAIEEKTDPQELKEALKSFTGIWRRFEVLVRSDSHIYIDDYAHHPVEISRTLEATRLIYPGKKILGVFQPHLYSRTRDFAESFAESLSELDELILLPVYPARERKIPGIGSEMIKEKIQNIPVGLAEKKQFPRLLKGFDFDVLITMGAGDIDRLARPIKKYLEHK